MHETVIEPEVGYKILEWAELRRYRDFFLFMVWRDVQVLYKQTILGFLWALIRPGLSVVVFSVVFGRLAQMPSDQVPYPLFAFAGLLPWTYYATCLTQSTQSLIAEASILTKVYVPRALIPAVSTVSNLVDLSIGTMFLFVLMAWYGIPITTKILIMPLILALLMWNALATGLWLSALAVQYRDVKHGAPFLAQLMMYMAPVVWPVSIVPSQYRLLYGFYPLSGVVEGFRVATLGVRPIPWDLLAAGACTTLVLFLAGALYFNRVERRFADIV